MCDLKIEMLQEPASPFLTFAMCGRPADLLGSAMGARHDFSELDIYTTRFKTGKCHTFCVTLMLQAQTIVCAVCCFAFFTSTQ
jgi:hypothetical protein